MRTPSRTRSLGLSCVSLALLTLLAASPPSSNVARGGTFSREGANVRYQHGNLAVRFQTDRGGAPLDFTYAGTRIIENFAGSGFQAVIYADNDLTQAGHNGVDPSPIARLNDPSSAMYNYYARETILNASTYQITGFFPFFWENFGIDVCYPAGSEGLWAEHDRSAGTPLWFVPRPGRTAAFAMVGRQNGAGLPPIAGIPDGRVAFQVNVSLATASADAFAGVTYRRAVPPGAITNDGVYNAPGYRLVVNKSGVVDLSGPRGSLYNSGARGDFRNSANSAAGIRLEIRTHNTYPSNQQVWIDGVNVANINAANDPNPVLGENIGLFASASGGRVGFLNRRVFDVSKEVELNYTANNEESLNVEVVVRKAPSVTRPIRIYGTTQQAFLVPQNPNLPRNPDLLNVYSDSTGWTSYALPYLFSPGGVDRLYAGSRALSPGLQCLPISAQIDGSPSTASHALIQIVGAGDSVSSQATIHVSANSPDSYTLGRDLSEARIKTRWRPYWSNNP